MKMPEGPEVLEYFNYINPILKGKTLESLNILSGKYLKKGLVNYDILMSKLPCKITDIVIKGKTIFIALEKRLGLVITHGMSGYWSTEQEKHSRLKFKLKDMDLYYVDTRNFGNVSICLNEEEFFFRQSKLGPYILKDRLSFNEFYSRLGKKVNSKIAIALLDQSLISGIGNYLRCDILWYAKINGETKIKDLTEQDKLKLYEASINICRYHANLSYKLKFTPCDYDRDFFIYMEEVDIYGNDVLTKKLNGRTFHYTS